MSLYKTRGVYAIHNKITNSYYIGCTNNNFGDRRDVHFAMLRKGYHHNKTLQAEFDKYGEYSLEFIVLKELNSDDEQDYYDLEKKYIAQFKETTFCINETDGGIGALGTRLSKERIKSLSEVNRKRMTGTKASETTRERMSQTRAKNQNRMGGACRSSILNESDVREIKISLMNGESCKNLAKKYDVSVQCISKINVGENWKSVLVDGWEEYLANRI